MLFARPSSMDRRGRTRGKRSSSTSVCSMIIAAIGVLIIVITFLSDTSLNNQSYLSEMFLVLGFVVSIAGCLLACCWKITAQCVDAEESDTISRTECIGGTNADHGQSSQEIAAGNRYPPVTSQTPAVLPSNAEYDIITLNVINNPNSTQTNNDGQGGVVPEEQQTFANNEPPSYDQVTAAHNGQQGYVLANSSDVPGTSEAEVNEDDRCSPPPPYDVAVSIMLKNIP